MKKSILILLMLMVLLLTVSCRGTENSAPTDTDVDSAVTASAHISGNPTASSEYWSFEKYVSSSTDVVKAKCLGKTDTPYYTEYEFAVTERFYGENVEGNIFVFFHNYMPICDAEKNPIVAEHRLNKVIYQTDTEYYLFLIRKVSVFYTHDHYWTNETLVIPADNVSAGILYGEPLDKHALNHTVQTERDLLNLIDELKDPEKQVFFYDGYPYIESADMNVILNQSECVVKLRIGEISSLYDREITKSCEVLSVLKGDLEVGMFIEPSFMPNSIEAGKEYIVALSYMEPGTPFMIISSKNSVFDVSQEEEIRAILAQGQE